MTPSRFFIGLTIGLSLASTSAMAAAPGQQTTALSDQQVATLLFQQQAKQGELEGQLAEVRRLLAEAKRANASRGPDPAVQNVDLAPLMAQQAKLEGELAGVNAEIAGLKLVIAGKADQSQLDALAARVTTLEGRRSPAPYDDTALRGRVTALENAEPAVVHDTHTHTNTVVRTTGFGLIGYAGVDVAITKSYLPVYGTASGRLVGGVRPAWNVGSGAAKFGLDIEGNWTPQVGVGSGFGLRAVPTLIGSFDGLDLGLGFGPAYDCSVLVAEGCLAEHIGGLARGTLLIGNGVGVRLHADVEVNYLTVSSDPEIRTVIGVDLFVGRRHDTYVQ